MMAMAIDAMIDLTYLEELQQRLRRAFPQELGPDYCLIETPEPSIVYKDLAPENLLVGDPDPIVEIWSFPTPEELAKVVATAAEDHPAEQPRRRRRRPNTRSSGWRRATGTWAKRQRRLRRVRARRREKNGWHRARPSWRQRVRAVSPRLPPMNPHRTPQAGEDERSQLKFEAPFTPLYEPPTTPLAWIARDSIRDSHDPRPAIPYHDLLDAAADRARELFAEKQERLACVWEMAFMENAIAAPAVLHDVDGRRCQEAMTTCYAKKDDEEAEKPLCHRKPHMFRTRSRGGDDLAIDGVVERHPGPLSSNSERRACAKCGSYGGDGKTCKGPNDSCKQCKSCGCWSGFGSTSCRTCFTRFPPRPVANGENAKTKGGKRSPSSPTRSSAKGGHGKRPKATPSTPKASGKKRNPSSPSRRLESASPSTKSPGAKRPKPLRYCANCKTADEMKRRGCKGSGRGARQCPACKCYISTASRKCGVCGHKIAAKEKAGSSGKGSAGGSSTSTSPAKAKRQKPDRHCETCGEVRRVGCIGAGKGAKQCPACKCYIGTASRKCGVCGHKIAAKENAGRSSKGSAGGSSTLPAKAKRQKPDRPCETCGEVRRVGCIGAGKGAKQCPACKCYVSTASRTCGICKHVFKTKSKRPPKPVGTKCCAHEHTETSELTPGGTTKTTLIVVGKCETDPTNPNKKKQKIATGIDFSAAGESQNTRRKRVARKLRDLQIEMDTQLEASQQKAQSLRQHKDAERNTQKERMRRLRAKRRELLRKKQRDENLDRQQRRDDKYEDIFMGNWGNAQQTGDSVDVPPRCKAVEEGVANAADAAIQAESRLLTRHKETGTSAFGHEYPWGDNNPRGHVRMKRLEEVELRVASKRLYEIGISAAHHCSACRRRHPELRMKEQKDGDESFTRPRLENQGGREPGQICLTCANDQTEAAKRKLPFKFCAENDLSLLLAPALNETPEQAKMRCALNACAMRLFRRLSRYEEACIRRTIPCVSIYQKAGGQFGYRGNVICLQNKAALESLSKKLPNRPDRTGFHHMRRSDQASGKFVDFRVRQDHVREALDFLVRGRWTDEDNIPHEGCGSWKGNPYWADVEIDEEYLKSLPKDGMIGDALPLWISDVEAPDLDISKLRCTVKLFRLWLADSQQHPDEHLACAAYNLWSDEYDFNLDMMALVSHIQKRQQDVPADEYLKLSNIVESIFGSESFQLESQYEDERREARSEEALEKVENRIHLDYIHRLKEEFERTAERHEGESVGHSFIPGAYKPARTVEEARLGGLRGMLDGDEQNADLHVERPDPEPIELKDGEDPVREDLAGLYAMSFPTIFFFGSGDLNADRPWPVNHGEWIKWVLYEEQMQAMKHPTFRYYVFNVQQRRTLAQTARLFTKENPDLLNLSTAADLDDLSDSQLNNMTKRLHRYLRNMPGTPAFMRQRRVECERFFDQAGYSNDAVQPEDYLPQVSDFVIHRGADGDDLCVVAAIVEEKARYTIKKVVGSEGVGDFRTQSLDVNWADLAQPSGRFYGQRRQDATFFATASFADLHCPGLHGLIVDWAGLSGSSCDPFEDGLGSKAAYERRLANVRDFPQIVVYYFNEKYRIFHEAVLPGLMGIDPSMALEDKVHLARWWYRFEFQARNSIHGHGFHWHANVPNFACLRRIMKSAKEQYYKENPGDEQSFDKDKFAQIANGMARDRSSKDGQIALKCAEWLSGFVDSSNRYYDEVARQCRSVGEPHPSQVPAVRPTRSTIDPVASSVPASDADGADGEGKESTDEMRIAKDGFTEVMAARINKDHQRLRGQTGRHDQCSAAYCLRVDKKTNKQVCRFEEQLRIRDPNESHFYIRGGQSNLKWEFYERKLDPVINKTNPTWSRWNRSNTDYKVILNVRGCIGYATKAVCYATKSEKNSPRFDGHLRAKIRHAMENGGAAPSVVLQRTLASGIQRDFGAQEIGLHTLQIPLVQCSHEFRHSFLYTAKARPDAAKEIVRAKARDDDDDDLVQNEKGRLEFKQNDQTAYELRLLYFDAETKGLFNSKSSLYLSDATKRTKEAKRGTLTKRKRLFQRLAQSSFEQFLREWDCKKRQGRCQNDIPRTTYEMYELTFIRKEGRRPRIAVVWPDYPKAMQYPGHPHHETFCEHQLRRFLPHYSAIKGWRADRGKIEKQGAVSNFEDLVDQLATKFRSEVKSTALDDCKAEDGLVAALAGLRAAQTKQDDDDDEKELARTRFHDAYSAFSAEQHIDHPAHFDIIDDGDLADEAQSDDEGAPLDHDGRADRAAETWMFLQQFDADLPSQETAYQDAAAEDFAANRAKYTSRQLGEMRRDWIKEQAAACNAGRANITPPPQEDVGLHQLNSEQRFAVELLLRWWTELCRFKDGERSTCPAPVKMIVYGKAGTGKSFVLKAFMSEIERRRPGSKCMVGIFAPSGVAAKNADSSAKTLHSGFGIRSEDGSNAEQLVDEDKYDERLYRLQSVHRDYEVYWIDEIGMTGSRLFGCVDLRLQEIFAASKGLPFGNKTVVGGGHHAQLPPVLDRALYDNNSKARLDEKQAVGHEAYAKLDDVVILRQQMRQRGADALTKRYKQLLDRLEEGRPTLDDWQFIKKLSADNLSNIEGRSDTWRLVATVKRKNEKNLRELVKVSKETGKPIARMQAVNSGKGAESFAARDAGGLEHDLYLCVGARVMVVINIWLVAGLANGSIGTVYDIIYEPGEGPPALPTAILVKFDPDQYYGPSFLEDVPGIVKFSVETRSWASTKGKATTYCSRTQFPLQLATSVTIHKSQGLSLECVLIDLGEKEYQPGLTYTAATRVKDPAKVAFCPVPSFFRLAACGRGSKLQMRRRHEAVLEEKAYQTILRYRRSIVDLPAGDYLRAAFVPRGWKQESTHGSRKHYGGSAVPLVVEIQARVRRWLAQRRKRVLGEGRVRMSASVGKVYKDMAAKWALARRERIRQEIAAKHAARQQMAREMAEKRAANAKSKKEAGKQKSVPGAPKKQARKKQAPRTKKNFSRKEARRQQQPLVLNPYEGWVQGVIDAAKQSKRLGLPSFPYYNLYNRVDWDGPLPEREGTAEMLDKLDSVAIHLHIVDFYGPSKLPALLKHYYGGKVGATVTGQLTSNSGIQQTGSTCALVAASAAVKLRQAELEMNRTGLQSEDLTTGNHVWDAWRKTDCRGAVDDWQSARDHIIDLGDEAPGWNANGEQFLSPAQTSRALIYFHSKAVGDESLLQPELEGPPCDRCDGHHLSRDCEQYETSRSTRGIRWCDPGGSIDQFNRTFMKRLNDVLRTGESSTTYYIVNNEESPPPGQTNGNHWTCVAFHIEEAEAPATPGDGANQELDADDEDDGDEDCLEESINVNTQSSKSSRRSLFGDKGGTGGSDCDIATQESSHSLASVPSNNKDASNDVDVDADLPVDSGSEESAEDGHNIEDGDQDDRKTMKEMDKAWDMYMQTAYGSGVASNDLETWDLSDNCDEPLPHSNHQVTHSAHETDADDEADGEAVLERLLQEEEESNQGRQRLLAGMIGRVGEDGRLQQFAPGAARDKQRSIVSMFAKQLQRRSDDRTHSDDGEDDACKELGGDEIDDEDDEQSCDLDGPTQVPPGNSEDDSEPGSGGDESQVDDEASFNSQGPTQDPPGSSEDGSEPGSGGDESQVDDEASFNSQGPTQDPPGSSEDGSEL